MQLVLGSEAVITFLLASVRVLATLLVSPPFNGGLVPVRIRLGLAVVVGVLLASGPTGEAATGGSPTVPLEVPALTLAVASQVLAGLVFGFFVQLLLAAFQSAGSIIDLSSGLSAGTLYDPLTLAQLGPVGRLYQLVSMMLLVSLDGHLVVVRGIMRSYEAAPFGVVDSAALAPALVTGAGQLLLASLEVAFPVLAALLLTEMALGIATRAAPRMNIMAVGFGVKSLVVFLLLGLALPLLGNATMSLLDLGLRAGSSLIRA